jgi:hypothetical protein
MRAFAAGIGCDPLCGKSRRPRRNQLDQIVDDKLSDEEAGRDLLRTTARKATVGRDPTSGSSAREAARVGPPDAFYGCNVDAAPRSL